MSPQLSLAAVASALALVALCLQGPTLGSGPGGAPTSPFTAAANAAAPALPSLFPR